MGTLFFRRIGFCITFGFATSVPAAPLIIDHASVGAFTNLTAADIARVKTMWADILGASHSLGFRVGCQLLETNVDSRFLVNVTESGEMEGYTTNHLRISRAYRDFTYNTWSYGGNEQTWYTSASDVELTKAHIGYSNTNGFGLSVIGLGWSWQMSWQNMNTGAIDPQYQVRWSGSSVGGPDGNLAWGVNDSSYPYTSNHVSVQTYLDATEQYRAFCQSNGYPTVVIFGTAPVDFTGDTAYQAFLKNSYIRSYVSNTADAVLFDYADILCWDDAGTRKTNAWTDLGGNPRFYEWIADDNYLNLDGSFGGSNPYHIGERGAVRIAKALWYMLAQISAPNPPVRPVLNVNRLNPEWVQMQFVASSNTSYAVEFSPDLSSGSWQTLTNFPAQPTEQTNQLSDSTVSIETNRFYRVKVQ